MSSENVLKLKEGYIVLQDRLHSLLNIDSSHSNKTITRDVYSALSSLIFISIGVSNVEELERFILSFASQIPSSLFDLNGEWLSFISLAKEVRTVSMLSQNNFAKKLQKKSDFLHYLTDKTVHNLNGELKSLRNDVYEELLSMKNFMDQITLSLQNVPNSGRITVEKIVEFLDSPKKEKDVSFNHKNDENQTKSLDFEEPTPVTEIAHKISNPSVQMKTFKNNLQMLTTIMTETALDSATRAIENLTNVKSNSNNNTTTNDINLQRMIDELEQSDVYLRDLLHKLESKLQQKSGLEDIENDLLACKQQLAEVNSTLNDGIEANKVNKNLDLTLKLPETQIISVESDIFEPKSTTKSPTAATTTTNRAANTTATNNNNNNNNNNNTLAHLSTELQGFHKQLDNFESTVNHSVDMLDQKLSAVVPNIAEITSKISVKSTTVAPAIVAKQSFSPRKATFSTIKVAKVEIPAVTVSSNVTTNNIPASTTVKDSTNNTAATSAVIQTSSSVDSINSFSQHFVTDTFESAAEAVVHALIELVVTGSAAALEAKNQLVYSPSKVNTVAVDSTKGFTTVESTVVIDKVAVNTSNEKNAVETEITSNSVNINLDAKMAAAANVNSAAATNSNNIPNNNTENKTENNTENKEEKNSDKAEKVRHNIDNTDNNSTTSDNVVVIQSAIRGFIAKQRVKNRRVFLAATNQQVLVAYAGTKQGDAGWYIADNQLYYFLLDQGEFLLLCGPISQEIYTIALDELRSSPRFNNTKDIAKDASALLSVDRLGLHATRIQIETLLDDLKQRDVTIQQLLYNLDHNSLRSSNGNNDQFSRYNAVINELEYKTQSMENSLTGLRKETMKLLGKITNSTGDNVDKSRLSTLSPTLNKSFISLSSVVRGFLGRQKFKRTKVFRLANETGVLVAMKNTVQGETGWYVGPNGTIFYFVLKNGDWIHTAGPISESEFEFVRTNTSRNHLMSKCAFNLTELFQEKINPTAGNVYLSGLNDKLYITTPVDELANSLMSRSNHLSNEMLNGELNGSVVSSISKARESADILDNGSLLTDNS